MQLNQINLTSAALELFAAIITTVLLVGCFLEKNYKNTTGKLLICALSAHTAMMLCDAPIWLLLAQPSPDKVVTVKILSVLSDTFACLLTALYAYCLTSYVSERKKISYTFAHVISVFCGILALLWFINAFNGMFISYDENGKDVHGPLNFFSQIGYVCLLAATIVIVLRNLKILELKDAFAWILFGALPIVTIPLQYFWDVTPVYISSTVSLIFVYTLIHIQNAKHSADMEKKLIEQELALSESRNTLALSQIQPHFLYNALTSIYRLCDVKPEKAKEAISDFSSYLRGNLDSIKKSNPIPFSDELKHINAYLSLEKIRYDDLLEVVYDIKVCEFFIPPLTVQPLIENAVTHGVSDLPEGGYIKLATEEFPDRYEVRVIDNGVGFDTERVPDDGRSHVGITNVRSRLEILCKGTLEIISSPDCGTTAIIKIPKGEN
ncbi:MAG: sensor histidine kinase [Candidatus Coproplasma sp.]